MFKFSLETVLRLNEQFEEQSKTKLGLVTQQLNQEVAVLQDLDAQQDELYTQFRDRQLVEGTELVHLHNFSRQLNGNRLRQQQVVDRFTQQVAEAKAELLVRKREVQKLERLKEKRLAEYTLEQQRAEQKLLDEISQGQYIRNNLQLRSVSI